MHKNLIFHLCLFTLLINTIKADEAETVTLISSDKVAFEITKDATLLSTMLARLLSAAFQEKEAKSINLHIESDQLTHIVKALEITAPVYGKPIAFLSAEERTRNEKHVIKQLIEHFNKIELSTRTLYHLLLNADFLDFPELVTTLIPLNARQLSLRKGNPKWPILPELLEQQLATLIIHKNSPAFYPVKGILPHKLLIRHKWPVVSAHFSPDNSLLVTASDDYTARIWDVKIGKELHVLKGHTYEVRSAEFSPDNKLIVTASNDKTVRIWDVETGGSLRILMKHIHLVYSAHFSSDNTLIVTASADKTARIWNVETGEQLHVLKHPNEVNLAHFSPDNKLVVTASVELAEQRRNITVKMWEAETGKELYTITKHNDLVSSAQFSSDNTLFVTASYDKTARICDVKTGEELHTLRGHTSGITSVQFSPDNRLIVTASSDKTARIWDVKTGEELRVLEGHTHEIYSADFSLDNNLILTAAYDKTARIWDVKTGKVLHTLRGHTNWVRFAQFSPHNTFIVTTSQDKTARIWDFTPIKDYILGNLSLGQALFIKMLGELPKGQNFASLAQHTEHYNVDDLSTIFKSFTPFIQKHLQKKYDLKGLTLAQRRRRMRRRLALRRQYLQARG